MRRVVALVAVPFMVSSLLMATTASADDSREGYRNNPAFSSSRRAEGGASGRSKAVVGPAKKVDQKAFGTVGAEAVRPGQTTVSVHGYTQIDVGLRAH